MTLLDRLLRVVGAVQHGQRAARRTSRQDWAQADLAHINATIAILAASDGRRDGTMTMEERDL